MAALAETQPMPAVRPPALPPFARIRRSKLHPPRPRADAVERVRLLRQLTATSELPIVLISGTAGYGKSTLAAQWGVHCGRQVLWVDLDRGDNDPTVLLRYLAHALDDLDLVPTELLDELSRREPRIEDVVLPSLAAELARRSPVELILDDVQELTEPGALAVLDFLLDETPPDSQIVIVTRVDPELPFARRRVSGDLFEIRADSLALDLDEARALAANVHSSLPEQALELLHKQTEGWPAGMALALQTRLPEASPGEVGTEIIAGTQRRISDYLMEVILARETEEHLRFLLATSVLRRMTAPLCDAVLQTTDSAEVLRELERSNSFVIALDDQGRWYRYHQRWGVVLR